MSHFLKRKIAPAMLVLACLGTIGWAGLRANAAWHYFAAQAIAKPLFENGNRDAEAFAASEYHGGLALQRFPGNPDYLDFVGRLWVLKASLPGVVGDERKALLEAAADNFRLALNTRPLWPYSWVNLLVTKDRLRQVDSEFELALHRAAETGPWEPWVQLRLVDTGLRNWSRLGRAERAIVEQKALDALKVQPRPMFALAKEYGRPELVCDAGDRHAQIRRWCEAVLPGKQG